MLMRCGVIGYPVAHSLSPVLHRAAYRDLGIEDLFTYERREITPDAGAQFLSSCVLPDSGWSGLSVTMPHKQTLMSQVDVLDPLAQVVGALNTVVFSRTTSDGPALTSGFNTDVEGIVEAVRDVQADTPDARDTAHHQPAPGSRAGTRALILGSGATACSSLAAVTQLGYTSITVAARSHEGPHRTSAAAERMGLTLTTTSLIPPHLHNDHQRCSQCDDTPSRFEGVDGKALTDHVCQLLTTADLTISTLPKGAADQWAYHLHHAAWHDGFSLQGRYLLDVIYDPWPSPLSCAWREAGGRIIPGYLMLLFQAVPQVMLMTGKRPDVQPMRHALYQALEERGLQVL